MRRRKKALAPRRKRISRAARLQSGRHWLGGYKGNNVVRSYARWFGIDLLSATRELQTLGVQVSAEYLERLRVPASQPRRRPPAREAPNPHLCVEPLGHGHYAYIAGYTAAGVPFGVTWGELEAAETDRGRFREDHQVESALGEDFVIKGDDEEPF
jgi:hypothetical protein